MLEYLGNNPFCIFGLMCLFWPGLFWMTLGYWLGRNGSPIEIKFRGRGGRRNDPEI
jgi:hypothetical protein